LLNAVSKEVGGRKRRKKDWPSLTHRRRGRARGKKKRKGDLGKVTTPPLLSR